MLREAQIKRILKSAAVRSNIRKLLLKSSAHFNREKSIKRAESREKMLDKIDACRKTDWRFNTDIHLKLEPSCRQWQ